MVEPPPRLPDETPRAYERFLRYCDMGTDRNQRGLYQALRDEGERVSYGQITQWSSRHRWVERSADYQRRLQDAWMAAAEDQRAQIRSEIMQAAMSAAHTVRALVEGSCSDGEQIPRLDRHGQIVVGPDGEPVTRPAVSPSVRLQAAKDALERAGVVPPRRYELEIGQKDGAEAEARTALGQLSVEQLEAIQAIVGEPQD